jgi:hypothetical protein
MNEQIIQEARQHTIAGEGKLNSYPHNTESWKLYEKTYGDTMAMIASRAGSSGYSIKLPV